MLTADRALMLLRDGCAGVGVSPASLAQARLLGPVGDNAVLLLPAEGVVVRMATGVGVAAAEHQLAVAHWLEEQGIPAVRVRRDVAQPRQVDDVTITFWEEIQGAESASTGAIGGLLRRLHALPIPENLLAAFDPWVKLTGYIDRASGLAPGDRDFLSAHLAELRDRVARVSFTLPVGPIHGDAHRKNLVRDRSGVVRLLDLDHVSVGQPEWDLTVPAVYRDVGWYSEPDYRDFVDAYGIDITAWDGYPVLAATRMLRMTAWLSARTGREPRLIPEATQRVASLRDPSAPKSWTPGV